MGGKSSERNGPDLRWLARSGWPLLAALASGCAVSTGSNGPATAETEGYTAVDDLYIVDCLLPGQVRRLGSMTYLSPRRPIRTTAGDCRLRGGEYVAYDRADYRSALKVWLAKAEEGDPEAQTYVGEIFEKGLGQEPDPTAAAAWYRKAAEQGFARAQINLGFLHEHGLGVEQDLAAALNWYRKASGVQTDELIFASDAQQKLDAVRAELETEIGLIRSQSDALQQQLALLGKQRDSLQQKLAAAAADKRAQESLTRQLAEARQQIDALQTLHTRSEMERQALDLKLASLPGNTYRSATIPPVLQPVRLEKMDPRVAEDIRFGRYFALIIGAGDYLYLNDLRSPINDAQRVQEILETHYGFSTRLLINADEKMILNALNDLYTQIGENDNLLIYYAGHGDLTEGHGSRMKRGYWLPVDAQADRNTHWISNTVISDHLDRLKARSILVIADSCYAGDLASESSPFLLGANSKLSKESIEVGLARRARLVISSGGTSPVLDSVDGEHSVFARSLVDVLTSNRQIVSDNMLFAQVAVNVRRRADGADHAPEMRPIRAAGHSGGSFYFVPQTSGQ